MSGEREVRIVLVGSSGCGKSTLISRFIKNTFLEEYKRTGFDKVQTKIEIAGRKINLTIWDTSGLKSYSVLRPLVYRESDVALVCYDIERRGQKNEDVKDEVEERRLEVRGWIDEVWSTLDIPVLICGCAADMLDTKTRDACALLPESLGMEGCLTSAKTGLNTRLIFEMCAAAALDCNKSTILKTKLRRPTSLKLEEVSREPVLRSISEKQKQLRLGISSLLVNKTELQNISRNTSCPSPFSSTLSQFSPYSPHSRSSQLVLQPLRPVPERPQSSQAQIQPNRLSCRPGRSTRPGSRARAVEPPTSPSCDNQPCYSPTSSLLSGPLSPTISILSPFSGPHSETSMTSPFQPASETSLTSPLPTLAESPYLQVSDRDSISSHSQTDSISVRATVPNYKWNRWGERGEKRTVWSGEGEWCKENPWSKGFKENTELRKKGFQDGKLDKCLIM